MTSPSDTAALAVIPAGFEPANLPEAYDFAERISKASLLPSALRQKPADVLVVLLTGRELGISPMQSLRGVHVIEGKGVASADLLVGLCKRHPACRWFRLVESTDDAATYETQREGEPEPTRMAYTIAQARAAGLAGKDNWKRHPAAMLRARCSAALARAVYPDVVQGLYDPDEADEMRARVARDVTPQQAREPAPVAEPAPAPPPVVVDAEPAEPSAPAAPPPTVTALPPDATPPKDYRGYAAPSYETMTGDEREAYVSLTTPERIAIWAKRFECCPDAASLAAAAGELRKLEADNSPVRKEAGSAYLARKRVMNGSGKAAA